ncbi:hypothetical protein ACFL9U_09760 [Thermodesulfobacteriota bacterium]
MANGNKKQKPAFSTKKCHECSYHIPLDAKVCDSCGKKVGPVDKHGHAKKPIDVISYVYAVLSWVLFATIIWWGFMKK